MISHDPGSSCGPAWCQTLELVCHQEPLHHPVLSDAWPLYLSRQVEHSESHEPMRSYSVKSSKARFDSWADDEPTSILSFITHCSVPLFQNTRSFIPKSDGANRLPCG